MHSPSPIHIEADPGMLRINVDGVEALTLTYTHARVLLGELASALLEAGAYHGSTGERLAQLLDDLAGGLLGHHPTPVPDGVDGHEIGNRR